MNWKIWITLPFIFGATVVYQKGLVASGGGLFWSNLVYLNPYSNGCPHPAFSAKHWCRHCTNDMDALQFSMGRIHETGRNTVAAGSMDFKLDELGRCKNADPVQVFECNLGSKHCVEKGKNCYTFHSSRTGHLFYGETFCTTADYY